MNNKALLQVQNLSIALKKKEANDLILVKDISFDLISGEILGIVGESGSGKSITSLSILQLLSEQLYISSGSVHFLGKNLVNASEKEMMKIRGKEIAMIFQEPMSSLNPLMKCGAQVDEMTLTHEKVSKNEAKSRSLDLFNRVQIPDPDRAYNAYPHQLSGGQLQRVMIAMALACCPSILIADECTTALDVTVQKEIIELLKELNASQDISIIFISHDLGVIKDIAENILVMKDGKLVEYGSTNTVFLQAKHPYTQQLIASKPPLDIDLHRLPQPSYFEDNQHSAASFYQENRKTEADVKTRKKIIEEAEKILEVQDLVKFYPQKHNFWGKPTAFVKAVNHVSFQVKKGETLGLVGESGCGKSTLSKAITRLIDSDAGDVLFKGESFFDLKERALRKKRKEIQYIFQDPFSSLNPRLTIGYAIQEPMAVHKILPTRSLRKEKTIELLELVGLEADHFSRYPHEFSGGQRQRICIARALSMEPDFLVCDEIVSALDVSVQAQVLNLLLDLREKFDLSMLFVSHDLAIVKFISDRLLVMQEGKIVEHGWADEIYKDPQNAYTEKLLAAIPGK